MTGNGGNQLDIAHAAAARLDWDEAMDAFTAADLVDPLPPGDLAQWAMVAYLMGNTETTLDALNRASQHFVAAGDLAAAARCGFWSAFTLFTRGDTAQASGWVGRCVRLVEGLPPDDIGNAYVLALELTYAVSSGQINGVGRDAARVAADAVVTRTRRQRATVG